jgi:hypothetical protein
MISSGSSAYTRYMNKTVAGTDEITNIPCRFSTPFSAVKNRYDEITGMARLIALKINSVWVFPIAVCKPVCIVKYPRKRQIDKARNRESLSMILNITAAIRLRYGNQSIS